MEKFVKEIAQIIHFHNLNPRWISESQVDPGHLVPPLDHPPCSWPGETGRLTVLAVSENGALSAGKAQKNGIPTGKIYEKYGEMMIRYQILGEKNYFDKPDMIQYA